METSVVTYDWIADDMFKSYYVVWKPTAKDGCFHQHIQFKSYYVVWKPHDIHHSSARPGSLNRTM